MISTISIVVAAVLAVLALVANTRVNTTLASARGCLGMDYSPEKDKLIGEYIHKIRIWAAVRLVAGVGVCLAALVYVATSF